MEIHNIKIDDRLVRLLLNFGQLYNKDFDSTVNLVLGYGFKKFIDEKNKSKITEYDIFVIDDKKTGE